MLQLGQIFTQLLKKTLLAVVYYNNALRINPTDRTSTLYNKALFYQR